MRIALVEASKAGNDDDSAGRSDWWRQGPNSATSSRSSSQATTEAVGAEIEKLERHVVRLEASAGRRPSRRSRHPLPSPAYNRFRAIGA